jgi:hypothetical protein
MGSPSHFAALSAANDPHNIVEVSLYAGATLPGAMLHSPSLWLNVYIFVTPGRVVCDDKQRAAPVMKRPVDDTFKTMSDCST